MEFNQKEIILLKEKKKKQNQLILHPKPNHFTDLSVVNLMLSAEMEEFNTINIVALEKFTISNLIEIIHCKSPEKDFVVFFLPHNYFFSF